MPNGVIIAANNQIIGPLTLATFSWMMPEVISRKV